MTKKLLLAALCSVLALSAQAQVAGYRGDGSCVYPNANPPTSCDEKTGQNILWKVPMPNWGHSFPIEMQGRVFVISEGGWPEKQDFPLLQCLDAATGKELWRKDLNHVPATGLSAADQEAGLKAWHEILADFRFNYTTFNEYIYAADDAGKTNAIAKWTALGRKYSGWSGGGYGQLRKLGPKYDAAKAKLAAKAGLTTATWQHECGMGQSCFGQSFPTPVTDGTHLYVVTAFGGFFCFDKDGNQVWVKYYPGKTGEYCRNGRSPLLYKDLLISDVTSLARGIDRKTGEMKWSQPVNDETMMTPVIITVGKTDVLLCFNKKAFRLPDGAPLTIEGGSDFGATALVKSDERDVVFFTGGGEHGGWTNKGKTEVMPPSCVKFSLEGDKLVGKVLWSGIDGQARSGHTGLLYHGGKLYCSGGYALDALTGKLVAGSLDKRSPNRIVPNAHHLLQLAGQHFYGLRETGKGSEGKPAQQATLEVYSLDGKKVGESVFANAPVEGPKQKQIIEQNGWNTWMFSYACPFTIAGNKLYIRSYDYLWCVAAKP